MNMRKQYKCIIDEFIPKGTVLTLEQQDVGHEDLTPYWTYTYSFVRDGNRTFGERTVKEVENTSNHYKLIENRKLSITGSRNFNDYELLKETMLSRPTLPSEIISGGANGADKLAERFALEFSIPFKLFPADWNKNGRAAGPIRNAEMADYVGEGIVFWDGQSKGSKNMIDNLHKQFKPCKVVHYDKLSDLPVGMVT